MAKLTKFLGNVFGGIFGGEGDMRDYQHAARLFTDQTMRLAPKVGFLYHVTFNIQNLAIRSPNRAFSKGAPQIECGLLVKDVKLPGVQVQTDTKNQYGKKTNYQTSVSYAPVNITFHDDNDGLVNGFWQQYFKANYNDSLYYQELYKQTPYQDANFVKFGMNSDRNVNFFQPEGISIYQLARHQFSEFTLINPMIQSWDPPSMTSGDSQPRENQMVVIYEGIKYATGRITTDNPTGFATLHYDRTPSPLSVMGGGTAGFFGAGGVLAGGLDVFGDIASGDAFANPFALIGTAIKAKNTVENAKQLTKEGVRREVQGITEKSLVNSARQTIDQKGVDKFDNAKRTKANVGNPSGASGQLTNNNTTGTNTTGTTTANQGQVN